MLNIISNYDIMQAISDNIILPPSYTIIEIKKTCGKKIGKTNKDITKNVLNKMFNIFFIFYQKIRYYLFF